MLRTRQKLGKYKIEHRLGQGAFAEVFQALDTIEGIHVALKIPHPSVVTPNTLDEFLKEVRLTARLEHPRIMPIKDASFIDGYFVVVQPLGEENLDSRLGRRVAFPTVLSLAEQIIEALAYAHERRIIHCDVKPENIIMFPENQLRLADFGLARVGNRTLDASGSGTVGYIAPEQAMGRPSQRSDVFSAGLIIYRMITGYLPEWPFRWPPQGIAILRHKAHAALVDFLQKSIEVNTRQRYRNAGEMLRAFQRVKNRAVQFHSRRLRRRSR